MNFDELSRYEIDGELQFIEIEHGFVYKKKTQQVLNISKISNN